MQGLQPKQAERTMDDLPVVS